MSFSDLNKRNKALRKNAKAFRGEETVKKPKVLIPDPIVFATEGTYIAQDQKPYTIVYERKNDVV